MMRSLFAGVSGLKSHQTRMDVIGNNISNVNTVGYKAGRVTFQDTLYQTIRSAAASTATRGGTNPVQVGLGVQVGSIDVIHTAGSPQPTGIQTDLAMNGNGFFVLKDGEHQLYTRAGVFDFDEAGWLGSPATGMRVAGWNAVDGVIDTNQPLQEIRVPIGETIPAVATTEAFLEGNLDAGSEQNTVVSRTVDAIDSLGVRHRFIIEFEKTGNNQWSWAAQDANGNPIGGSGSLVFNSDGTLDLTHPNTVIPDITFNPENGAEPLQITPDFSRISQYGQPSQVDVRSRNGYAAGSLEEIRFDGTGVITGVFSNGLTRTLAQLAVATFSNNGGLIRAGDTAFEASRNSGMPQIGAAGTGDRGLMTPGALEMSNVDLSEEFTSMIVTQRGFQANSRIITTSDEMLQELVNLKR